MAIRSYRFTEQWIFAPRPVVAPLPETAWKTPSEWKWIADRRITSSAGYVEIFSQEADEPPRVRRRPNLTPGYHRSTNLRLLKPRDLPALSGRAGEKRWTVPGIGYYFRPTRTENYPLVITSELGYSTFALNSNPLAATRPTAISPTLAKAFPRAQTATVVTGLAIGAQYVVISWWLIAAPFLMAPLMWGILLFKRFRARKRNSQNRCIACGYNLTANTSGICPECGRAITHNEASHT